MFLAGAARCGPWPTSRSPNPNCGFEGSPFYVNAELRDWPRGEVPRRAGISSLLVYYQKSGRMASLTQAGWRP